MGLPLEPEDWATMIDRFPAALEGVWGLGNVLAGDTPGKHRRHVFDFEDGARIIVSVDNFGPLAEDGGDDIRLHLSGSAMGQVNADAMATIVLRFDRLAESLTLRQRTLRYVGTTDGHVMHWVGLHPWETPAGFGNLGGGV